MTVEQVNTFGDRGTDNEIQNTTLEPFAWTMYEA